MQAAPPSPYSAPLLAVAASAATVLVTPPRSLAKAATTGVAPAQALSAPVTLAGWSTAAAAITHAGSVRIRSHGTIARQARLECPPFTIANAVEGRQSAIMRQADLAGAPQIPANQLNPRSSQ